jgi:hypothetical protein
MFPARSAQLGNRLCLFAIAAFLSARLWASPTVWTGPTITFTKNTSLPALDPANLDHLTDNVILARDTSEGMFNKATEANYVRFSSPDDTEWATAVNNPTATISATNYAALSFTTWAAAYGGPGFELSQHITTDNAVVHLITDDVYLDLKFTQFDSSGLFAYQRSTPAAAPTPTGDYNGDGVVDAADYTVWRDTLGQSVPNGTGADGNADGTINAADYTFWLNHFGQIVPGAGSRSAVAAPEPASAVMLLFGALGGLPVLGRHFGRRCHCRRKQNAITSLPTASEH